MPHSHRQLHGALNGMLLVDFVGAATSRPPGNGPERSVEWHHVTDRTNSPSPVHHFWLVLRGRLVAAPTMTSLQITISVSDVFFPFLSKYTKQVADIYEIQRFFPLFYPRLAFCSHLWYIAGNEHCIQYSIFDLKSKERRTCMPLKRSWPGMPGWNP